MLSSADSIEKNLLLCTVFENFIEFVFYKNHCIYTHNDGFKYYCAPSCDYDPNGPLYTILKNGGVEDKNIRSLCPWKTSISIDEKDNAVVVRGCKKEQYI